MCGIFGIIGQAGAPRIVHEGLRRLEYRGYDSAGIAWLDNGVNTAKAVGPVSNLHVPDAQATVAIGHTRWATHGGVSLENAHPHLDAPERAAVVHNGVLLNHLATRGRLMGNGVVFRSETDSENLIHLWRESAEAGKSVWGRLADVLSSLEGTYSVAFLDSDAQQIAVAKHRNPLWIAHKAGVAYLASDAVALAPHLDRAIPLEDGDRAILSLSGIEIRDASGAVVERNSLPLDGLASEPLLGAYPHFMLKEIEETPHVVNQLLAWHLHRHSAAVAPPNLHPSEFMGLGAGTSFYAAQLTAEYMRRLAAIPASAHATPEWKDEPIIPAADALVAAFTQSGETLDTVQALARLHSHPQTVLAFTNYPQSTIGRQSDITVPLRSGVEVSVAATKTFLSQSVLGLMLALQFGIERGVQSHGNVQEVLSELVRLPRSLDAIANHGGMAEHGTWLAQYSDVFVLAKGIDLPAAREGALKLKEIAYQHAEPYPAGELKHGPFALLTETTPVVFLLGPGDHANSIRNSMEEVAARGSPTLVLAIGNVAVDEDKHRVIRLPAAPRLLHPLLHAAALHLLSYWTARARNLPIDKPRNLAKSVTVE